MEIFEHIWSGGIISADTSVATVDANGNVTAVAAGTAYIYPVAPSGAFEKTRITVYGASRR